MTNEFQFVPSVDNNWLNRGFFSHQTVYPLDGVREVNFKQSLADFVHNSLINCVDTTITLKQKSRILGYTSVRLYCSKRLDYNVRFTFF